MIAEAPTPETKTEKKCECTCKSYPFLLLASTTVAAVFCFMYVTKPTTPTALQPPTPTIQTPPVKVDPATTSPAPETKLLPDTSKLPGDETAPEADIPDPTLHNILTDSPANEPPRELNPPAINEEKSLSEPNPAKP